MWRLAVMALLAQAAMKPQMPQLSPHPEARLNREPPVAAASPNTHAT
jgi:hypothetical protein